MTPLSQPAEKALLPWEMERLTEEVENELLNAEMRYQAPAAVEQLRQTLIGNSPGKYILVILDCATRFPGAIPLWNITAWAIVAKIFKVFA
ncbi:unnamed protein product [Caretta caretta]